ncbi:protein PEP-RELATED DEVELOPMENT ARRESTED 1, chloroplastic-like isoform X2 [Diospyros lotus]|uniref:protein PEP-RELATED DEVELOPMENT ARRESTED 1, chloroplastic-like isoform X2 n=1 Tax=Diospyros lotus TaxID=55363 RepID=UPI00225B1A51|nr:protein PEP-RELATED DEVELOPMENT ARRESTED 1, chloroplastic-like isoform X2 [Diospyros lotus]
MATLSAIPNPTTSQYTLLLHSANLTNKAGFNSFPTPLFQLPNRQLRQLTKRQHFLAPCSTHDVGGGFRLPIDEFDAQTTTTSSNDAKQEDQKWHPSQYDALLKGGEQVTSVLQEMIKLLDNMNMDEASEEVAVQLAAQGVIGKRVDEMETGFMMALDYMIQIAEKDKDDKRKSLLEGIKETILSHLTKKCPPHVQVVGLLCQTHGKESRQELLRRVAAGGGVFQSDNGRTKVHLPAANLNDIANQADDLLESMETHPTIPDRKLLARLVLIREEARSMMGGGILDERNGRGFSTLPESEVNFLTKLVSLRPGKTVREMIKNVMQGKDEGADDFSGKNATGSSTSTGIAGKGSVSGVKPLPVRPGMFLETVTKVLGGIYSGNVSGITAQQLEWVLEDTSLAGNT